MDQDDTQPQPDLSALANGVERLNESRFIQMHNSLPKLLWIQLLKGLALGLGSVIGATLLVSIAVLILTNIDFIPIIGDWAAQIAAQMENSP